MSDKILYKRVIKRLHEDPDIYVIENGCRTAVLPRKNAVRRARECFVSQLSAELDEYFYRVDENRLYLLIRRIKSTIGITDAELCSVNEIISILIIRYLAKSGGETVANCVFTLRTLAKYDHTVLYTAFSEVHRGFIDNTGCAYASSDEATKRVYRELCVKKAVRENKSEYETAFEYGDSLIGSDVRTGYRIIYFISIYLLPLILSVILVVYTRYAAIGIFSYLPLTETFRFLIDRLYSYTIHPHIIPALDISEIPDDAVTLTVVTSLVGTKDEDERLLENLENFYLANSGKNRYFAISADLRDADHAEIPDDEGCFLRLRAGCDLLNEKYGRCFCIFSRGRRYSESEGKFISWERKRGAVIELCRLLRAKSGDMTVYGVGLPELLKVKYLITLDSDTQLGINNVLKLCAKMLHPLNRPVISNGIVRSGYGVMQPKVEISAKSSQRNPFTAMISAYPGHDEYHSAAYESYQTLFGEGIYCGKGIIDVSAYLETCADSFASDSVLSHDLLEGTRLRAAYLSDIAFTDGVPQTPISYYKRQHRWLRGDILALFYMFTNIRNIDNCNIRNYVNILSRYKIADNLRRALVPVSAAITVIISFSLPQPQAFAAVIASLSYIIMPSAAALFTMRGDGSIGYYSHILPPWRNGLKNSAWRIASLFYEAYVSLDAIVRTLWRKFVSHRHILEWTTAADGDSTSGRRASDYADRFLMSVIAGIALMLSPAVAVKLIGVCWVLMPFAAFRMSRAYKNSPPLTDDERAGIVSQARDMWSFYRDLCTSHRSYLPPDNIQFSPEYEIAERTSPTNIGLYMLCCLAAQDFGFIDSEEVENRVSLTLDSIDKLEKWNGHLYNWYDTVTLGVIGEPFISTVDSGNLICALSILRTALNCERLCRRIDHIIEETDFTKLYDSRRGAFYIGFDTSAKRYSENHYDCYMSEFRTTAYICAANGKIDTRCFTSLAKHAVTDGRHIGMRSWSGTMFEYFMPSLFLPFIPGTFEGEALVYAANKQRDKTVCGLWGTSESGYFAFDAALRYQYKAFGCPSLAMAAGLGRESVISPYSSYLAMKVIPRAAISNLKRLRERGMYGLYGFYEAIDFTASRTGGEGAVVASFMAHHVGMSVIACANACFDNIFTGRFMSVKRFSAYKQLLELKAPYDGTVFISPPQNNDEEQRIASDSRKLLDESHEWAAGTRAVLISNNKSRITACTDGRIFLSDGGKAITYPVFEGDGLRGFRSYAKSGNEVFCITDGKLYTNRASLRCTTSDFHMLMTVGSDSAVWSADLYSDDEPSEFMVIFEPVMCPTNDYIAHPSFMELSVECEYITDEKIILYRRRARRENEKSAYLAAAFSDINIRFGFESRRDDILGINYGAGDIEALFGQTFGNVDGACIHPVCAVRTDAVRSARLLIAFAYSRREALDIIRKSRVKVTDIRPVLLARYAFADISSDNARRGEDIFTLMRLRSNTLCTLDVPSPQRELWKYGVSGDYPILYCPLSGCFGENKRIVGEIKSLLHIFLFYTVAGYRFELVFSCGDSDKYSSPDAKALYDLITRCGGERFVSQSCGIFVIENGENSALFESRASLVLPLSDDAAIDNILARALSSLIPFRPRTALTGIATDDGSECAFYNGGYHINSTKPRVPWSYIYTNHGFGTLLTHRSLGFTWYKNAGQNRITRWNNDILRRQRDERLTAEVGGVRYDLCSCANSVDFGHGSAVYSGIVGNVRYKVYAGCAVLLPVKLIYVEYSELRDIRFECDIVLGDGSTPRNMII
ncbi:MAG: glucoamylase family protein, partial [Eubacteriales bacterium]